MGLRLLSSPRVGNLILLFVLGLLTLSGCVTVDDNPLEPRSDEETGPLLKKQIEKRIEGLKYQRGVALLDSLNWLILYGDSAIPQLLEALRSPDPRTRSYAAYVLGEIGNEEVVSTIREVLDQETHKLVKYEMAASLVTLGDWGQIGLLISGLEEDARLFRFKCFEVLRKNLNLTLGYDPEGPEKERIASVSKWKAWWERNQKNYTPILKE